MKERNGRIIKFNPDSGIMTITPLGCLLAGCVAVTLYVVCVWQAIFWSDVFGMRREVGARPAPAIARERPT